MKFFRFYIFLFFVLFVFVGQVYSQELQVKWGPALEDSDNYSYTSLGWEDANFYAVKNKGSDLFIEKFSENMSLLSSTEVDIKLEKNNAFKDHFILKDGKLYVITYVNEIVIYTFNLNGEEQEKFEILEFPIDMSISVTDDKSQISMAYFSNDYKEKPWLLRAVYLFTGEKSELKTYDVAFDSELEFVSIEEQVADQYGNQYLSIYGFFGANTEKQRKLIVLNNEGKIMLEQELKIGEYFLENISMTSNDEVVGITGMYYSLNENGIKSYNGFFHTLLDIYTHEFSDFHSYVFGQDFISKYQKEADRKGNFTITGTYDMKIIPSSEGGGYIVGEKYYSYDGSLYQDELLVFNYSEDGRITNMSLIPKSNIYNSKYVGCIGYYGFERNGILNIIYYDHGDNMQITYPHSQKHIHDPFDNDAVTVLSTVNSSGAVVRNVWSRNSEKEEFLNIMGIHCDNEGTRVIEFRGKKGMRYGIVKM